MILRQESKCSNRYHLHTKLEIFTIDFARGGVADSAISYMDFYYNVRSIYVILLKSTHKSGKIEDIQRRICICPDP